MERGNDDTAALHQSGEGVEQKTRYEQYLDELLDEALKETFPASDAIAVTPRRYPAP